jgi:flagellar assembly protein FliH
MPSSSDGTAGTHTVRPARFDRPLAGAAAAVLGAGWGDPRLDAALAEAVEDGRRRGMAEGYAIGWAAGLRAAAEREEQEAAARAQTAEAERRERLARTASLLQSLAGSARDLAAAAAPTWEELADVLADGALAIAGAALARELTSVDDDLVLRVRTALRTLAGDGRLVVHLHPDDAALLARTPLPDGAELVPDDAVRPGTVAVRGDVQRLRLDVTAAVAAAEEVLRS